MKRLLSLAFLLVLMASPALGAAPAAERLTITDQGLEREYYFYRPGRLAGDRDVPLVVCLHGYGGTAWDCFPGLLATAEREGFAVCFPQGAPLTLPLYRPGSNQVILHRYTGGRNGVEVHLYEIVGGGHSHGTADLPTADIVWAFFNNYSRAAR